MAGSLLNNRVRAVIDNEWAQLAGNKVVIFTTLVPPLLLVLLGVAVLNLSAMINVAVPVGSGETPLSGQAATMLGPGSASADGLKASLLNPFLLIFQMIPLIVPMTIASYSIVGEKQNRSLEAVLATPIRTWELLLAKALAAAIPGVLATWYSFAIFVFAAQFALSEPLLKSVVLSLTWLLTVLILTPLLTLLAVGTGIIISSRVKDPSSAQQLGSLLILPVIGALVAQIVGAVNYSAELVLVIGGILFLLDGTLLAVGVRLFRREEILTRWR